MPIPFDHRLRADVPEAGLDWQPAGAPAPEWLHFNEVLARELGLDVAELSGQSALAWWAGNTPLPGAQPMAQAYAGHQFGGFSPQLGDGRALLLGDWVAPSGQRLDLAFKGSGRTPFARGGDGKAAVGPMLRELLVSEALHALGIPTTRVLTVVRTGETIRRDRPLPGALMSRVAASHLRVGTFEYFSVRGQHEVMARLLRHAVARHAPGLLEPGMGDGELALAFLDEVLRRQAALVTQWLSVGFIHGVMNTDNMALSGESIDFGPCAFMEAYDPDAVFSSIDHQGRYAYGQQASIAQWNLARFAESLLPLMGEDSDRAVAQATEVIERFPAVFKQAYLQRMAAKLGLPGTWAQAQPEAVEALLAPFLEWLHHHAIDFTLGFLALERLVQGELDDEGLRAALPEGVPGRALAPLREWAQAWRAAWAPEGEEAVSARLRAANPVRIPRNHHMERVLEAASLRGDLQPMQDWLAALREPFERREAWAAFDQPAAASFTRHYATFCGT